MADARHVTVTIYESSKEKIGYGSFIMTDRGEPKAAEKINVRKDPHRNGGLLLYIN